MGKQNEKCSASKLYTLGNLYIRYILHASMHCVSRELAQHKIMYELFYWLSKWTSLESFFLSRFLFIFSFSCFAKCLSLMQINVEAILLTISTECSWNKFITSGYDFCGASSVFILNVYSLYAVNQCTHHYLYLLNALRA